MTISEATSYRITELCKEKKLSGYSVTYKACLLYTSPSPRDA